LDKKYCFLTKYQGFLMFISLVFAQDSWFLKKIGFFCFAKVLDAYWQSNKQNLIQSSGL